MTLGEKIKRARQERRMTQKELVGEYITRNMLSKIENGSATPSIKTLEYLAGVLGLQPGFFMADLEEGELPGGIDGARTAYRRGNYEKALECISKMALPAAEMGDEAVLLSAKCCARVASKAFRDGDLVSARAYAREGLKHSAAGIYADPLSEAECAQILMLHAIHTGNAAEYGRYAVRMNAALALEGLAQRAPLIETLKTGALVDRRISEKNLTDPWSRAVYFYLCGKQRGESGDAAGAAEQFLLAEQEAIGYGGKLLLGDVYAALEQVYSQMEDFKQAYHYASKRLELSL